MLASCLSCFASNTTDMGFYQACLLSHIPMLLWRSKVKGQYTIEWRGYMYFISDKLAFSRIPQVLGRCTYSQLMLVGMKTRKQLLKCGPEWIYFSYRPWYLAELLMELALFTNYLESSSKVGGGADDRKLARSRHGLETSKKFCLLWASVSWDLSQTNNII